MKRFLSTVLALLMLISVVPATLIPTFAADGLKQDASGNYLIYTKSDLKAFADLVNGGKATLNAKLMADIDMENTGVSIGKITNANDWASVKSDKPYSGTFDGNGCTIYNFAQDQTAAGLFGMLKNATVKNLTVIGKVSGRRSGGIATAATGNVTIEKCAFIGVVKSNGGHYHSVGGFVGLVQGGGNIKVSDSYTLGGVYPAYSTTSNNYNGGFFGWITKGKVSMKNCYTAMDIGETGGQIGAGNAKCGSLAGNVDSWSGGGLSTENCYYTSEISKGENTAGGANKQGTKVALEELTNGKLLDKLNAGYETGIWKVATGTGCTATGGRNKEITSTFDKNATIITWKLPQEFDHVATFMADGEVVAKVMFKGLAYSLDEPEVPYKKGYDGVWEPYALGTSDITVNAVYTKREINAAPNVSAAGLKVDGSISIVYAVDMDQLSEIIDPYDLAMEFKFNGETTLVTDYTVDDDGYALFDMSGIDAKEMTDVVTARVVLKVQNKILYGAVSEYSVATYIKNMLAKSKDAALRDMLKAMAEYGAAAQKYFEYNTSKLPTDGLYYTSDSLDAIKDKALELLKDETLGGKFSARDDSVAGVITGASLTLDNAISIDYAADLEAFGGSFTEYGLLAWNTMQDDYSYTSAKRNGFIVTDYTIADGKTVFTLANIPASLMSIQYYACVYAKNAEGKYVYSDVVSYSINDYQRDFLDGQYELKLLMETMAAYGEASRIYFDEKVPEAEDVDNFIRYTITLMADGKVYDKVTYKDGASGVALPEVPAKEGFDGVWEDFELSNKNITVNAVYGELEHKATFKADGEVVAEVLFADISKVLKAPEVPAKLGYTGTWASYKLEGKDIVVEANYKPISYVLTFVIDGTVVGKTKFNVETKIDDITFPEIPAKDNFDGEWEAFTIGAHNITINALYKWSTEPFSASASITQYKNGALGAVTFHHDDGDTTTMDFLAEQYAKNGLVGSVGLITNRFVTDSGELKTNEVKKWQSYLDTGLFQFDSHTRSHNYNKNDNDRMWNELVGAQEDIRKAFPSQKALIFIIPGYGDGKAWRSAYTDEQIGWVTDHYIGARSTSEKDSNLPATFRLTNSLIIMDQGWSQFGNYMKPHIDNASKNKAFQAFIFHNLRQNGDGGLTQNFANMIQTFEYLKTKVEAGEIWNGFFQDVTQYVMEYDTAKVACEVSSDYRTVSVTVTDTLDDEKWFYPLTVKVKVASNWKAVKLTLADGTESVVDTFVDGNSTYAYVNIVPDSGTATVTRAK